MNKEYFEFKRVYRPRGYERSIASVLLSECHRVSLRSNILICYIAGRLIVISATFYSLPVYDFCGALCLIALSEEEIHVARMSRHHEHEISEHPEVQWALDLLKPDASQEPFVLQKYASEIVFMGSGLAIACLTNWFNRRPMYAGIQAHVALMAGGYFLAQYTNKYVEKYHAEQDTRLRDYIIRHPELFPEPKREKYSEVLQPWVPIR